MDLNTFLVIVHIIGTALGLGGAFIAEAQINVALKDGVVKDEERRLLHANYFLIRVGLFLVIVSGVALVFNHLSLGNDWVINSAKIWAKDIMVIVIIFNAFLLTKRLMPLWLGSSISLTSWLGATILGGWRGIEFNIYEILIGYVVIIFIMAFILSYIRKLYLSRK